MTSTGFQPPPQWQWPSDIPAATAGTSDGGCQLPGSFEEEPMGEPFGHGQPLHESHSNEKWEPAEERPYATKADSNRGTESNSRTEPNARTESNSRRHWPPRTCRICLEVVPPTFSTPSEHLPESLQPAPSVSYLSEDPEAGRLLRPCKCKGSSKYVHEGCLQSWRHADPNSKRNYWQCPTCGFRYRLERMNWGRWISSNVAQIGLTVTIFVSAMFLLGFIADPIINFYLDPYSAISTHPLENLKTKIDPILSKDEVPSWPEHFLKGFASLGLLGFVKFLFTLGPWHWFQVRNSGLMGGGGRAGNTGRDRLANLSWGMIIIGVAALLWGIYKGVRAWSRRTLELAGEKVMDVSSDAHNDEED